MIYPPEELKSLLDKCHAAGSTEERGDALECLCRFLFEKVDGVRFHARDLLNAKRSQEIDLSFWVATHSPLSFMPYVLLVEAKNRTDRVGSQEVNWFVSKLERRKLTHGILVAMNGISGSDKRGSHAWDVVIKAVHDGIRVVVLTREDLDSLSCADDLVRRIQDRVLHITMLA